MARCPASPGPRAEPSPPQRVSSAKANESPEYLVPGNERQGQSSSREQQFPGPGGSSERSALPPHSSPRRLSPSRGHTRWSAGTIGARRRLAPPPVCRPQVPSSLPGFEYRTTPARYKRDRPCSTGARRHGRHSALGLDSQYVDRGRPPIAATPLRRRPLHRARDPASAGRGRCHRSARDRR